MSMFQIGKGLRDSFLRLGSSIFETVINFVFNWHLCSLLQ